jgi:hypothetical protein
MSRGEIDDVIHLLLKDLRQLWPPLDDVSPRAWQDRPASSADDRAGQASTRRPAPRQTVGRRGACVEDPGGSLDAPAPGCPEGFVVAIDLATWGFVPRKENVLLVGQSASAESHLAQALGHRACLAGYEVLYTPSHQLLGSMRAARADGSYERRLARLADVDVLVLDDLGLHLLRHDEPKVTPR